MGFEYFFFIAGAISLGTCDPIAIRPHKPVTLSSGSNTKIKCTYDLDLIDAVAWFGPDGTKITNNGERQTIVPSGNNVALTLKDLTIKDSGTYVCSGLLDNGEKAKASWQVTVYDKPEDNGTLTTQNFVIGSDANVICRFKGYPEPIVTWVRLRDGKDMAGIPDGTVSVSGGNLKIANVSESDEGFYACEGYQDLSQELADVMIRVVVNTPPKIHRWKKRRIVVSGETETFVCYARGDPDPDIRWYKEDKGAERTQASNSSELIVDATPELEGSLFVCVASNLAGNVSASLAIKVDVKPRVTITGAGVIAEGGSAILQCVADGVPPPSLVWIREEEELNETGDFSEMSDNVTGSWSSDRFVEYSEGEANLTFTNVKFTDRGMYSCRASNRAGVDESETNLEVRYAPRAKRRSSSKWSCVDSATSSILKCEFESNPVATIEWGKYMGDDENATELVIFDSSQPIEGISFSDDFSTLKVDVRTAEDPFGTYFCNASNSFGFDTTEVKLIQARKPDAPYDVKVVNIGTREFEIQFRVHPEPDYVTYIDFLLIYGPAGGQNNYTSFSAVTDRDRYDFKVTGLKHDTDYEVFVQSRNCEGESAQSDTEQFRTHRIEAPGAVTLISGNVSDSGSGYSVQWEVGSLGGGSITDAQIEVYEVIVGIDFDEKKRINSTNFTARDLQEIGSFQIADLSPDQSYELRFTVWNEVGNATVSQFFRTFPKPTPTEVQTGTSPEFSVAALDSILIVVIIVVLIGMFIIIDVACCCLKDCGGSYWIYSKTCMKDSKADVENGNSEFRQAEGKESSDLLVDDEKRPLAGGTALNGDSTLSKIEEADEATSCGKDAGNGTTEGVIEGEIANTEVEICKTQSD